MCDENGITWNSHDMLCRRTQEVDRMALLLALLQCHPEVLKNMHDDTDHMVVRIRSQFFLPHMAAGVETNNETHNPFV